MINNVASYTMATIHLIDATLDEENSHNFLQMYFLQKKFRHTYKYPKLSLDEMYIMTSNFALFYAKIREQNSDKVFQTNYPLNVFRYIMLEDGSWSNYYTLKRKHGYIVEGMYWSNGMMYQLREEIGKQNKIHEITLSIDSMTKTMYRFPDEES